MVFWLLLIGLAVAVSVLFYIHARDMERVKWLEQEFRLPVNVG